MFWFIQCSIFSGPECFAGGEWEGGGDKTPRRWNETGIHPPLNHIRNWIFVPLAVVLLIAAKISTHFTESAVRSMTMILVIAFKFNLTAWMHVTPILWIHTLQTFTKAILSAFISICNSWNERYQLKTHIFFIRKYLDHDRLLLLEKRMRLCKLYSAFSYNFSFPNSWGQTWGMESIFH